MLENQAKIVEDNLIFKFIHGSHAYGINTAASDIDYRGIFISPKKLTLSLSSGIEQVEDKLIDSVIYELKKFIILATECNPNIIEFLYIPDDCIIFTSPIFEKIKQHRHLFLSKKAKHTFSGYAYAQLQRIKGHHKWIQNPQPVERPKIHDYCKFIGLDGVIIKNSDEILKLSKDNFLVNTFGKSQFRVFNSSSFFKEKLGFFSQDNQNIKYVDINDDTLQQKAKYTGFLFLNLDEYTKDCNNWKHYWEWKKNRNPVRSALEEKYGFDVKHASHLVRLYNMCEEILTTHEVIVRRPDAQLLIEIRNGKFNYDELMKFVENKEKKLDELYETSSLRHSPDIEAISNLYIEIVMEHWNKSDH